MTSKVTAALVAVVLFLAAVWLLKAVGWWPE